MEDTKELVCWNHETNEFFILGPDWYAYKSTAGEWSFDVNAIRTAEELQDFESIGDEAECGRLLAEARGSRQ